MRIHSDRLARTDFYRAINDASLGLRGVYLETYSEHGSRSRRQAFEVRLAAFDGTGHNRKRNSGQYGAGGLCAATYDEWGEYVAVLFDIDPDAVVPHVYDGREDFNLKTGGKYRRQTAADKL